MSERRTLQELVGISVNSSSLRIEARAPGGETSLLRVAGLGAAVLHVQHGADRIGPNRRGGPVAEALAAPGHVPAPLDQIAGELGGVLYHLRYGGQHGLVGQAITLFAGYIGLRRRFGPEGFLAAVGDAQRVALLRRFAGRVLHEWLSDRCVACGGSGKLERVDGGSWVKPLGRMKRNAVLRVCTSCHGSRRQMPSHTARRVALGIEIKAYEYEGWGQHFNAGLSWLTNVMHKRLNRPLTVQLERSKKRV